MNPLVVTTEDYHTGGEPFRIVVDGAPELEGENVLARRTFARRHVDGIRRLLVNEPRGHADMYGCHIVPPDDDGAAFGAVFFHKDGYSSACGHGTIALGAWAVERGIVEPGPTGETDVVIDVPSGRVTARVRMEGGRLAAVVFRNVPARVTGRGIDVATDLGTVTAHVAWGGASYASVALDQTGLSVNPEHLGELIRLGRQVKWALDDHPAARHPDDRLSGVYGTILWEPVTGSDAGQGGLHQRNVTVFADGQVDRSPCGSGTSARIALLHEEDALERGGVLVHDSIVGSRFLGRLVDPTTDRGHPAVVTEIEGTAHPTGHHRFVLEEDDELGTGFQLR